MSYFEPCKLRARVSSISRIPRTRKSRGSKPSSRGCGSARHETPNAARSDARRSRARSAAHEDALFQPELATRGEQVDRLANALLACLGLFRRVNPDDEVSSLARRERPEELPSVRVRLERFRD